jgi:phosphoribosylformylglycinamidine synthase
MKMDGSTGEVAGASVQIGDPIVQKRALDVLLAARDAGLYDAVTDCGAGGLSSAVGEMARELGAEIELSGLGTKYPGLAPWELWLSEAQERMVLAIPPRHVKAFSELCSIFESEFWDIGAFGSNSELKVRMKYELVLDLDMVFLHQGLPKKLLVAQEPLQKSLQEPLQKSLKTNVVDLKGQFLKLLGSQEVASRERIVRRYDHEVQGNSVIKPFVGAFCDSPSDAAVLKPREAAGEWGMALSNGFRSDYGELDPYRGAWAAVDEAMRNIVASGGDPQQTAILDNFCMGDPNDPGVMWSLLESARGLREAALSFHTPIISGKDSFYNEYMGADGSRHAVPPSLLVSALAFVPKVERIVTTFLKQPGDSIWLVGDFKPAAIWENEVPDISPKAPKVYGALFDAIQEGEVLAAHDLSEGGLAVALAEMCIGARLGARIRLPDMNEKRNNPISETMEQDNILGASWLALFGETMGCLLVEVSAGKEEQFAARFATDFSNARLEQENLAKRLGEVSKEPSLEIGDPFLFSVSMKEMLEAWKGASQELLP